MIKWYPLNVKFKTVASMLYWQSKRVVQSINYCEEFRYRNVQQCTSLEENFIVLFTMTVRLRHLVLAPSFGRNETCWRKETIQLLFNQSSRQSNLHLSWNNFHRYNKSGGVPRFGLVSKYVRCVMFFAGSLLRSGFHIGSLPRSGAV